jgi:hypothetical protein
VFLQVYNECVTGPSSFHFHGIKGNSLKQVFECHANTYPMCLDGLVSSCFRSSYEERSEGILGKRAVAIFVFVGKEMALLRWVVDLHVVF